MHKAAIQKVTRSDVRRMLENSVHDVSLGGVQPMWGVGVNSLKAPVGAKTYSAAQLTSARGVG